MNILNQISAKLEPYCITGICYDMAPIVILDTSAASHSAICDMALYTSQLLSGRAIEHLHIISWDRHMRPYNNGKPVDMHVLASYSSCSDEHNMANVNSLHQYITSGDMSFDNRDVYIVTTGVVINPENVPDAIYALKFDYTNVNVYILLVAGNAYATPFGNQLINKRHQLFKYVTQIYQCDAGYADGASIRTYNFEYQTWKNQRITPDNYMVFCESVFHIDNYLEVLDILAPYLSYLDELLAEYFSIMIYKFIHNKPRDYYPIYNLCRPINNIIIPYDKQYYVDNSDIHYGTVWEEFKGTYSTRINIFTMFATNALTYSYVTFPLQTNSTSFTIYELENPHNILCDIRINAHIYIKSGVVLNGHKCPIIPVLNPHDNSIDIRYFGRIYQWATIVISHMYGINYGSDAVPYLALITYAKLALARQSGILNVPDHIIATFGRIAHILFHKRRPNSNTTEFDFIDYGNPPTVSNHYDYHTIDHLLAHCMKLTGIAGMQPMTLWYALVLMANIGWFRCEIRQIPYCKHAIRNDFNIDITTCPLSHGRFADAVMPLLTRTSYTYKKIAPIKRAMQSVMHNTNDYSDTDYITYERIAGDDKLVILPHKYRATICRPTYSILADTYTHMLETHRTAAIICPNCKTTPIEYVALRTTNASIACHEADDDAAHLNNISDARFQIGRNYPMLLDYGDSECLAPMEDYMAPPSPSIGAEFAPSDECNIPFVIYGHVLNRMRMRNSQEFHTAVALNYPEINALTFKGYIIAGGMCKSIILHQPINDVDIFKIGPIATADIVREICALFAGRPNITILATHKPTYNVTEILCVANMHTGHQDLTADAGGSCNKLDIDIISKYTLLNINKVVYRFQIIEKSFGDMDAVVASFDMDPSKVCYDGRTVYFTPASYYAFAYMVNNIDRVTWQPATASRILKYYYAGFMIAYANPATRNLMKRMGLNIWGNLIDTSPAPYNKSFRTHHLALTNQRDMALASEDPDTRYISRESYSSHPYTILHQMLEYYKKHNIAITILQ
jgi:hypothetical protein